MPAPFSGGCAAGAIRYERAPDLLITLNCHCRDYQRANGSAYAALLNGPVERYGGARGGQAKPAK